MRETSSTVLLTAHPASNTARHRMLWVAVVAVAIAVYLNTLANGFALDDVPIIRDNTRVHDLYALRDIWLTPYWPHLGEELGLWRPMAIFLYALQWAIGGGSPVLFHAVNVALHALVTFLVFALLARLTASVPAFWGALIFAVHPVHTEVVANVVGQAELVAAAATLFACLIVARRPPGNEVTLRQSLGIVLCFLIAVLSKEHAVVMPALLVLIDVAQRRVHLSFAGLRQYCRSLALPVMLVLGALSAYLAARLYVLDGALIGVHAGPQLHYLHGEFRVLNALRAFPEFIRLMFFPWRLAVDYSPAMILPAEAVTGMVIMGASFLALCLVLTAITPWRPSIGLPAAWFLFTILTVSNLLFAVGILLAERTLYLPSFAVSAAVAAGWYHTSHYWPQSGKLALQAALVVAVFAGGYRTWIRNPDWRSTATVQHALMRDHPESYKAQWTHATVNWQLGTFDLARSHFQLAIRIYPYDSDMLTEYGSFLLQLGDRDEAMGVLEQARVIHPNRPTPVFLLGTTLLELGRYDDARQLGLQAVADGVPRSAALPILAGAYNGLGLHAEALAIWRQLIRDADLPPMYWAQLARTLSARDALLDARAALRRGLEAARGDTAAIRVLHEIELSMREQAPVSGSDAGAGVQ
jgi:protein O-mannosyl-transferase